MVFLLGSGPRKGQITEFVFFGGLTPYVNEGISWTDKSYDVVEK